MAASIRAGQSWDLRLPYPSLRVTLRVGTQKQPTFMHLLTGLRLQHPPRGSNSHLCSSEASKRELPGSESQNDNCCRKSAPTNVGGYGGYRISSGGGIGDRFPLENGCDKSRAAGRV